MQVLNVNDALRGLEEPWSPVVAARANGQDVRLARFDGAFDWHSHPDEDEVFYVVSGELVVETREGEHPMGAGDLLVVPRGTEHRPVSDGGALVMMFEPSGTRNTGDVSTARTRGELPEL
jgi:mannose-6-phosphate isomerase-like protein (cupin superfamily)